MSDDSDLEAVLARVCDEETFIVFLAALSEDWNDEQRKEAVHPSSPYGPGANGWENGTIGMFLEAASAFGSDHLSNPVSRLKHSNTWRQAAAIIYGGKFYE